jgi:alkylation response protein AidB-like acyl-CoA dehydrogenase
MFSLELSDIQKTILETAKKFATEVIAPGAIERDINHEFPKEILRQLGELGFMGVTVPEEYDGVGLDTISYVLALREIAKADAGVAIPVSVQNSLVNWIFYNYGNDHLKEKYLKPLARGEMIGAYSLSEPEAGSDARMLTTRAEFIDGKWVINGLKNWVSTGVSADIYVVFAQTNPDLAHRGIAAFAIEKGTPGFESLKKEDKMGMHSSETVSLALTNVEVPEENVIGKVGEGFYIAMRALNGGRIGIAAQAVGIAQAALEKSVRYAKDRKTMGKPISEHQIIQYKLSQMSMKISAAEMLVFKAAYLRDSNADHARAASEAKLFATTIANEVTREAVQIHGGYGYTREYEVERLMRDAKVTEIYEGTSEIQSLVIARELFKEID